ncbi:MULTISPECIES: hypothetical protein [Brevibacillus]|jgi:hypothetical protein|uniref:Uncharacterized protein n=1 Tax=Brevibacillus borstelensis AK1 TaxID=1300222 RepID=M8DW94_9BACL|nr:hypothetical protein [Brevibacillus borstelensis]EMT51276.1 hypothetical protein I532_18687 [Brevibacillus borstelensis AK1]KKX57194.1 hypothetical protein X546_01375 [Brevibacillus borstelensis cifa_chp40]RNB65187.1 hypothetical protein EDM54_04540 [Brevibacillus borstelensis]WNF06457.1 hypothetical protein RFB14_03185 [Brevibacillus borstelensis]GED53227.1 hypothetical protein BBO01nite_24680 [Brevibacillus borstelensis]
MLKKFFDFICKGFFHPLDKLILLFLVSWISKLLSEWTGVFFIGVPTLILLIIFTTPRFEKTWFAQKVLNPLGSISVIALLVIGMILMIT